MKYFVNVKDFISGCFKSWTMWFNGLLAIALPFADQLVAQLMVALPQLKEFLGTNIYMKVGLLAVILNMMLRAKTTTALKDK